MYGQVPGLSLGCVSEWTYNLSLSHALDPVGPKTLVLHEDEDEDYEEDFEDAEAGDQDSQDEDDLLEDFRNRIYFN